MVWTVVSPSNFVTNIVPIHVNVNALGYPCYQFWIDIVMCYCYWWRGSVVRTLVFGWWTFLDLCLIYGWHVTTLWVKCLLWVNQPGQLSLPSLWGQ